MSVDEDTTAELGSTASEIFLGALSVLSLVNIVLIIGIRNDAIRNVVLAVDDVLSLVFLLDFIARLKRAPSRGHYFFRGFGWADLLASLPFPQVKVLRIFRLIRVARLLRREGIRVIGGRLIRDPAGSALFTLLFIAILVLEFGSLLMLHFEDGIPGANITTSSDALWYVVVTMSTVGYGDQYPVGTAGRELGALIIVIGVGIFGTLTGYLANQFLSPRNQKDAHHPATLADARAQIATLKHLLGEQQAALSRLEQTLPFTGSPPNTTPPERADG